MTSGDIVLLNPEDAHSGAPYGEGWSYRMLTLKPDTIADLTRDRRNFGGSPLFREAVIEDELTRWKLAALIATHELLPELLDEQLAEFHAHLIERHGGGSTEQTAPIDADALTGIRDILVEEPFRSRSLADSSAASSLSRTPANDFSGAAVAIWAFVTSGNWGLGATSLPQ